MPTWSIPGWGEELFCSRKDAQLGSSCTLCPVLRVFWAQWDLSLGKKDPTRIL